MPRRNRDYKRTGFFRDTRLFVIATEGFKREPKYFATLASGSTQVRVKTLPPDEDSQRSAPLDVLRRARDYTDEIDLAQDDQMWLVMDVDRWLPRTLHKVAKYCQRRGWGLAISNPCFELWLYLHIEPLPNDVVYTSKEMKRALDGIVKGGYKVEAFTRLIEMAIHNAKQTDTSDAYQLTGPMRTQLWRLGEGLLPFLVVKD